MTVYLVYSCETGSDHERIEQAFTTKERAEAEVARLGSKEGPRGLRREYWVEGLEVVG